MFSESQIPQELCSLRSEIWIPLRTQKLKYFALFIILFFMCMYRNMGTCQSWFPPALDRGQTLAQPERLRPSVTGSNLGVGFLGGTQVDFQAGELVSPTCKLYIHFD